MAQPQGLWLHRLLSFGLALVLALLPAAVFAAEEEPAELGDEVAAEFIENFGEETVKRYGVRYHVTMQRAIAMQLESAGVRSENIDDCRICTYDMWETFFSHRRTNGRRGNFGAVIELK